MENKITLENTVKKNILIVDDTEMNRILLSKILQTEGYNTKEACNGEHALKEIEKSMPDLILCDVDMPKMNGFKFLEKIMGEKKYNHLKVIMNSAGGYEPRDFMDYKNVIKYLSKPFERIELIDAIKHAIYNSK
jgi:CheY-like chemotaxis protein